MVTSDHADLSRASSIASHVPRCTKLSLPAVDCLLQVRHPPLRDRPGGVGPRGEASAPELRSLASVRSVWVARTPRACPERASRVQRLARRPIRPSWACRSWVRCACPAASPDARNGWYFVYTSNREEAAFFAILTELSRKVSIARPSKPPFSRLELTISRLSQRLMRLKIGKNTFSRPFDAYYRVPSRLGSEGSPTCAHLVTIL